MTQAYSGGSYDSGAGSYGGGYYSSPGPGGYLDAVDDLTGPGSTAYLHSGPYSSYAYEGYDGNFYERNETQFSGGYSKSTSYYVSNGAYTYSHDTLTDYNATPSYYNDDGIGNGVIESYTSSAYQMYYGNGYEAIDMQSFSRTTYGDGAYHDTYSSTSGAYEDGMKVAGSGTDYSSSTYGYLSSYSS